MRRLKESLGELKKFQDSFLKDKDGAYERRRLAPCRNDDDTLLTVQASMREGYIAGWNDSVEKMGLLDLVKELADKKNKGFIAELCREKLREIGEL